MISFLKFIAVAIVGFMAITAPAMAAPALEVYGRLPGFETAKLSPSGKRVAIVGVVNDERRLIVTEGDTLLITTTVGTQKVRGLHWAGDDQIMLEVSNTAPLGIGFTADKVELTSMVVVAISSKRVWSVFDGYSKVAGGIRGFYGTVERAGRWYGYFGGITVEKAGTGEAFLSNGRPELYEVDLEAKQYRRIARRFTDQEASRSWLIGADGNVAATLEFFTKSGIWQIRNADRVVVAQGTAPTGDIDLIGLGRTPGTVIYLSGDEENGRQLIEQPLAGGQGTEILTEVSVSGYRFDNRTFQLIGYVEEGDIPEDHFFAPRQERIMAATRKAFPGLTVWLSDWNDSFDKLLVATSGVGEADGWWLVDIKTGKADNLGNAYSVHPADVGPMRMLTYKAADGLEIAGVLTLPPGRPAKNLPVIMLPHGGPHARDYPTFNYWAQAFASRGYAVFQPNFRGSTGSGARFLRAGWGEWGRKMQTDISDGLSELSRQGIVDPKRACIVGLSYGGYAALAGVTVQQGLYRCAISIAGIGDISKMLRDDVRESGHDATMIRSLKQTVGIGRDMKPVSPITFASRADAPVLLIHGVDDTVVPFSQSSDMLGALKRAGKAVELIKLAGEDHWLSKSETRLTTLKAAVAFAEKHNPPDATPAAN